MSSIRGRFRLDWPGFALDVALDLPGQGISVLYGPSGCGKTTILRCLAGLVQSQGQLEVNGVMWQSQDDWLPTHRRPIGYVFQEASLFPHLSVMRNLDYGRRRSATADRIDLDRVIRLLGIEHLLDRKPGALSGGERQRVGIARALATNPQLLLMDEPLAALDHARKQEILPYLERLQHELALPVVYVTHAADEVGRLANHLVVLDQGKVMASGPLTEMLSQLDLPIHLGGEAGVVIDVTAGAIDADWHLQRVDFAGGHLWIRDQQRSPSERFRARVLARDVSLARERPVGTSFQNLLLGTVDAIAPGEHLAVATVRVRVGGIALLATVTRRALAELGVTSGSDIWVQVKSVAVIQ